MPFKAGTYEHEDGFTIMVTEDGVIMLSPNHPLSLRLSVLFDTTKWTKISQKGHQSHLAVYRLVRLRFD